MPVWDGSSELSIRHAAEALTAGRLVAFPTETVYGLGARADADDAVAAIYAAKGRPRDHPLIVHVGSLEAASHFADLAALPVAHMLASQFWPGPLTLIVPRRPGVAGAAAGGQGSIGLRWPAHPVAQALLQAAAALGVAGVAAPSANRFGRVSPTLARHVVAEFGPELIVLDGGACRVGIESTIVDCTRAHPALLRPGMLERSLIESVLGEALREPGGAAPRAPGTLEAHYAPQARLRLMDSRMLQQALEVLQGGEPPKGLAVYSRTVRRVAPGIVFRAMPEQAADAARELFSVLRDFDAGGVRLIWVETPPPEPAWEGVRDRLQRAAAS